MQAALGTVSGAATQIVMMMTSLAYMPAVGIAIAGTTLVGQSIGAGDRDWARKMGNSAIKLILQAEPRFNTRRSARRDKKRPRHQQEELRS